MGTKNTAKWNNDADNWGADFNDGKLILRQDTTEIVSYDLEDPAFDDAVDGEILLLGVPMTESAAASGQINNGLLISNGDTYQVTGMSVGLAGTEIIVNTLDVDMGDDVTLIRVKYKAPQTTKAP